jgi:hypothetical protein
MDAATLKPSELALRGNPTRRRVCLSLVWIKGSETEEHKIISSCKNLEASYTAATFLGGKNLQPNWMGGVAALKIFSKRSHFWYGTHTLEKRTA